MKLKKIVSLLICIILPFTFFACKKDDSTNENKNFNVNEAKTKITKVNELQSDFFIALYNVESIDKLNEENGCQFFSKVLIETLNAVKTMLDNYATIAQATDSNGKKHLEQNENGFVYIKGEDEITVFMAENKTKLHLKTKTSDMELKIRCVNDNTYAITILDNKGSKSFQVYFTGVAGRVKYNEHIIEIDDIFEITDFNNFIVDNGSGDFISNEWWRFLWDLKQILLGGCRVFLVHH